MWKASPRPSVRCRSADRTQSDDFAAEPDELLALLLSAGLLAALSPFLGLASLLPEPDSPDPEELASELDDFDDESESEELDELVEDARDAEPLRESLL